jgi:hypothetical protein
MKRRPAWHYVLLGILTCAAASVGAGWWSQ